jgi:hypothetical protein
LNTARAYDVYGLCVRANRAIPGLALAPEGEGRPGDLWVEMAGPRPPGEAPASPAVVLHTSPERDEEGRPYFHAYRLGEGARAPVQLHWSNGDGYFEFLVDRAGRRVRATWSEAVSYPDVVPILTGPVLGCVLRLRGVTCLHASAIAVGHGDDAVAIALVAAKFGGKSTLAAALAGCGQAVLTDDLVALAEDKGRFLVQPGYPRLRLYPDSAAALPGAGTASLSPLWTDVNVEKRYLDLAADPGASRWRFQPRPAPLVAVYVLADPGPAGTAPRVTLIPPTAGLITLAQSTFMNYLLDRTGRARDLQVLGRLADTVPLRQVDRPASLAGLAPTCEAILDDVAAIRRGLAAEGS